MNNSWLKDIINKVFRSEQPLYFYIGLNVMLFLFTGIAGGVLFLSGKDAGYVNELVTQYLTFPADLAAFPTRFYTLVTYQFLHSGLMHLLFNMLALYWIGMIFSDFLKPRQFHFVYFFGGITGALLFLAGYNFLPPLAGEAGRAVLIGSSASVMAIAAAAATLVPDYALRLMFFGFVRLKYLVIALIALDVLFISSNAGTGLAHIGGALAGFAYTRLLQTGIDLSSWLKKKPRLKVVKNKKFTAKNPDFVDQQEIDAILDKISGSGYDKLTKEEKERLFKASKK